MRYTTRLQLEVLEGRLTPSSSTVWLDPRHLTVSFVPDGTLVGNAPSNLQQTLNAAFPGGNWRQEVLRALQTWAVLGDVNLGVVADGGQPIGTQGAVQGDSRFGDIRIAARDLGSSVLATGSAFRLDGSTLSGDIVLNSAYPFGNGSNGTYDLFSVVLHEAGHVFGLADCDKVGSALYERYSGSQLTLSEKDLEDFASLYAPRSPDRYEGNRGNETPGTASSLGNLATPIQADITTLSDTDWYRLTIPNSLVPGSTVYLRMRTSGQSLLLGSLAVYDGKNQLLGEAVGGSVLDGLLTVTLENVTSGAVYFVRVSNSTQSVFGIGAYQLELSTQRDQVSVRPVPTLTNADNHKNDSFASATLLTARTNTTLTLDYSFQGSISVPTDTDYYKVRSPAVAGAGSELIVVVSAAELGGLQPLAWVYDAAQNPVASQVIANDNGFFSVRISGYQADSLYYVKVGTQVATPQGGNYLLGVNFNATAKVAVQKFAAGALDAAMPQQVQRLDVLQASAFQFILTAEGLAGSGVAVAIYDQTGHIVFGMTANAGQPGRTGIAYLAPGTYVVRYLVVSLNGQPVSNVRYALEGWRASDPIGPELLGSTTTTTKTTDTTSLYLYYYTDYAWTDPSYLALDLWPTFYPSLGF